MSPNAPQNQTPYGVSSKTISQMAAQHDVSLRTLRFYEDRKLLFPQRVGLARLYSPIDEIHLQLIQKGKRLGFSLAEIERLLFGSNSEERQPGPLQERIEITHRLTKQQIAERIAILEEKRDSVCTAIDELSKIQPEDRI